MTVTNTRFIRTALVLDAAASGALAILAIAAAPLLSPLLGLPQALLVWAGVLLVPWVALLVVLARRSSVARMLLIDVVALNALWVAASFGLLASGLVTPTVLGSAFVLLQALAVAGFAVLQMMALRRATAGEATA